MEVYPAIYRLGIGGTARRWPEGRKPGKPAHGLAVSLAGPEYHVGSSGSGCVPAGRSRDRSWIRPGEGIAGRDWLPPSVAAPQGTVAMVIKLRMLLYW